MVLVYDRGAEHRHQAVAHSPTDRAVVAVDGVHHHLHGAVEQLLGVFVVAAMNQRRRADDVSEQHGDLLALALQLGAAGGTGQLARRLDDLSRASNLSRRCARPRGDQRLAASVAEAAGRWVGMPAPATDEAQRCAAAVTEPGARRILRATGRAPHHPRSS
jgi:hypothetical protein